MENDEQNLHEPGGMSTCLTCTVALRRRGGSETVFEGLTAEHCSNMIESINPQIPRGSENPKQENLTITPNNQISRKK